MIINASHNLTTQNSNFPINSEQFFEISIKVDAETQELNRDTNKIIVDLQSHDDIVSTDNENHKTIFILSHNYFTQSTR